MTEQQAARVIELLEKILSELGDANLTLRRIYAQQN